MATASGKSMPDNDMLARDLRRIEEDLQRAQEKRERLTESVLNPDESRTDILISRIERLMAREQDLKDLYAKKDMQRNHGKDPELVC